MMIMTDDDDDDAYCRTIASASISCNAMLHLFGSSWKLTVSASSTSCLLECSTAQPPHHHHYHCRLTRQTPSCVGCSYHRSWPDTRRSSTTCSGDEPPATVSIVHLSIIYLSVIYLSIIYLSIVHLSIICLSVIYLWE